METKIGLERYNQILWAILGTAVLVLVVIGAIALVVSLATAYVGPGQNGVPVDVVANPGKPESGPKVSVDMCAPVRIAGTPYQLIGIEVDRIVRHNRTVTTARKLKAGLGSSFSGDESPEVGCIYGSNGSLSVSGNVLIRDVRDGSMHLVLAQNAVIDDLEYPVPPDKPGERQGFPPRGLLYWQITTDDSNGDGVMDDQDDAGAYLSNIDGSGLVRITPPESRILDKSYDASGNRLYLKIRRDTNHDKVLDDKDGTALIEVDLTTRKAVRTIVDSKDWPKQARTITPLNFLH